MWKNRQRKRVPEFISVRVEIIKILVKSCNRYMDRIRMRRCRKSCVARPREGAGMQLASSEKQSA